MSPADVSGLFNFVPSNSLYSNQVAHQADVYTGFCSMKRLGVFLVPLNGMLGPCRVNPGIKFAGISSHTPGPGCSKAG